MVVLKTNGNRDNNNNSSSGDGLTIESATSSSSTSTQQSAKRNYYYYPPGNGNAGFAFNDVQFVQVRYTDVPGRFLAKYFCIDDDDGNYNNGGGGSGISSSKGSENDDLEKLFSLFRSGIGVDGSSVKGFATIDDSDLLLVPDRTTLRQAPISRFKVATIISDVYQGFGKGRLLRDPRYVAQLVEEELLTGEGLSCQVGPEVECFIFDDIVFDRNGGSSNNNNKGGIASSSIRNSGKVRRSAGERGEGEGEADDDDLSSSSGGSAFGQDINEDLQIVSLEQLGQSKYPIRRKGGYDAPPFQDSMYEMRFEIADILKKHFFINVTNLNHEVASSGQIEINFKHSTLTRAADNVQIYKDVVRNVAKQHNKVANFMPKPIFDESNPRNGDNGSGMHTSISLWTKSPSSSASTGNSVNIFYDQDDSYAELSQKGRYFIGGVMEHASSLAALVAPTVNSYRRMVPGFEAPVYVAWSKANRSAILRVPTNDRNNAAAKRIEFRAPDPSANPYLAFSAVVSAGLDGIKKRIDPGDSVDKDIYKMSNVERSSHGIKSLPGSLAESLEELKSDSGYLRPCFPDELMDVYVALKQQEVREVGAIKRQEFMYYYDI